MFSFWLNIIRYVLSVNQKFCSMLLMFFLKPFSYSLGIGTTVTTTNLFKNIPVRKQYYSNVKRRKEELKKVEDLLMSYGAIRCDIRVSLSHNKKPVWQKNKTLSQRSALLNTWGSGVMKQMIETQKTDAVTQVGVGWLDETDGGSLHYCCLSERHNV